MQGIIHQVSISKGGVPKLAIPEASAGRLGLEGDVQRNTKYHGGPRQALLLISLEDLEALQAKGFPVSPGAMGENLTVSGIDFRQLRAGMRFRAGEAFVELTKLRTPCNTLSVYNPDGEFGPLQGELFDAKAKAGDATTPRWAMGGFYAAVVQPGLIRAGDIIQLLDLAV